MVEVSNTQKKPKTNNLSNSSKEQTRPNNFSSSQNNFDENSSMYFSVSLQKFVVMNLFTFGLYQIYWMYKNWCLVKIREKSNLWPFLRSFPFPMFFIYFLLKRIKTTGDSANISPSISPMFLFLSWLIGGIIAGLLGPLLAVIVYTLALYPVQSFVNDINKAYNPNIKVNSSYSGWNILVIVLVGILIISQVIA